MSVYGITDIESALVKFTGNTTISVTDGAGYAQIFDANDVLDWNSLTIEMADGSGFSGLEFALQFLNADVSQQSPGTLGITVNYVGGSASTSYADFTNPGNRSFYLYGDAGEVIKSVTLTAAPDRFSQLKQTDIGIVRAPAVPEPATWALLVAGFGVVGSALRRRKASVAFA
ncbi:MAG: PEP-CTERM sorting domain-containing protein [Sphingomonas sp.]|nr:PEP-CTERM sorting domain-containing protein [Sphingomonas sp.]